MKETTLTVERQEETALTNQPLDAMARQKAVDDLLAKVGLVQDVMKRVMLKDEHYGLIPGCGNKPALFKSGAEKLAMVFRLKNRLTLEIVDLENGHREYRSTCELSDGSMAKGSCSTMENKYRYRQGERRCPKCGLATIYRSKEKDGGYYCWAKKGGCGAKFTDDDPTIVGQQVGKVEHDNPADFYNTCLQMSSKRAFVQAVRMATACSDIFRPEPADEVEQDDPSEYGLGQSNPKTEEPAKPAERKFVGTVISVSDPKPGQRGKAAFAVGFQDSAPRQLTAWTYEQAVVTLCSELMDTRETAKVSLVQAGDKLSWMIQKVERADAP